MDEHIFDRKATDLIKGSSIILMVYHHLFIHRGRGRCFVSLFDVLGDEVRFQAALFGKICVAIFFLLSGFGINRGRTDFFSFSREVGKVFSRLKKLYINYWKVFVVFIPLGFVMGKLKFSPIEFILNFVGWSHSYNIEWWVIRKYSLIILTTPVLAIIFQKVSLKYRIVVESFGLAVVGTVKALSLYYPLFLKISNVLDTFLPWYMIFLTGYIVAEHRVFETMEQRISKMSGGGGLHGAF